MVACSTGIVKGQGKKKGQRLGTAETRHRAHEDADGNAPQHDRKNGGRGELAGRCEYVPESSFHLSLPFHRLRP